MRGQKYKFAMAFTLILFLLSCSRMLDVKPVGHARDKEFWDEFRNGYRNLNGEQYGFFVFQNINDFQTAPVDIQLEGAKKWQNDFPNDPWPPDNPPETIPAAKVPAREEPGNNIRYLRENIYTKTIWDFLK